MITKDLATFDEVVRHLYLDCKLSTYQIAKGLKATQGKVARSLNRSKTPRRTAWYATNVLRRHAA